MRGSRWMADVPTPPCYIAQRRNSPAAHAAGMLAHLSEGVHPIILVHRVRCGCPHSISLQARAEHVEGSEASAYCALFRMQPKAACAIP